MGWGDELMATGMARGAAARGKRVAFGDGNRIVWGPWSEPMFRFNPNIAKPGDEAASDLEWVAHYKGHRLYNESNGQRWLWNYGFSAVPGEMFFDQAERKFAESVDRGFVLIEPNLPRNKSVAPNKDWGVAKYRQVAKRLAAKGYKVIQFAHGRHRLPGVRVVDAPDFRKALSFLSRAGLYVGPEGGLHHGAAAVGVPGVVLFGGFVPPQVTGYETHTNFTGGAQACGSLHECGHCKAAMEAISVDEVVHAAMNHLKRAA